MGEENQPFDEAAYRERINRLDLFGLEQLAEYRRCKKWQVLQVALKLAREKQGQQ